MVYLEKLDTADANKRILEYRKKEEAENPDEQFMDSASYCEYTDSMGYVVYIGKNDDGYLKTKRRKESLFGEYRYYFLNGNLKESGEYYFNDFHCGIWREYDEEGNLLKETDMDKPYKKYSWQNILLFAKKRNIDFHDDQTSIERYIDESNIPCWYITWKDKTEAYFHLVTIDARNGDIIEDNIAYGKL
ncbi:Uncharacterised protein [Segatella oris]|uniref:MORN repeat variant n=2 Tax=Segatella oris TaxID=28135 RepID=A0A3S4T3B2_9BACT|nr:Uncharacterised protein [Segatella oris]